MSLALYEREIAERRTAAPKTAVPEASAWDGFARGTGIAAMQTFAKAGRAASMALAAPSIIADAVTDGTELQDKYFRRHDDIFGEAVDYWTPKPGEVGVAGQITGQLLATLPLLLASPAGTVAATQMGVTEDLARKGVDPAAAIATGTVQGAGLGLGIYVPIFGKTLAQRVLLGGAGFNLFQGVATRGASEVILEGTQAAEDFKAFDPTALTLDVLMGVAFGTIAHLSPAQRAQGAEFVKKIEPWLKNADPSQTDALLIMRQAQHLNADSAPGRPAGPDDVGAHVARARQAIDQLARDQKVDVSDLPEGRFEVDEPRIREMAMRAQEMVRMADDVRQAEGIPTETEATVRSPSDDPEKWMLKTRAWKDRDAARATKVGDHKDVILYRTDEGDGFAYIKAVQGERIVGDVFYGPVEYGRLEGSVEVDPNVRRQGIATAMYRMIESLTGKKLRPAPKHSMDAEAFWNQPNRSFGELTEAPPASRGAEPPPPRSDEGRPGGAEAEGETVRAPEVEEARAFAAERGDMEITIGRDADGQPIRKKLNDFLKESDDQVKLATEDAKLFEVAALCMLGGA